MNFVVRITNGQSARGDPHYVIRRHWPPGRAGMHFNIDLERGYGLVWVEAREIDVLSRPHRDHQAGVRPRDA